jgi:hypothetical protein
MGKDHLSVPAAKNLVKQIRRSKRQVGTRYPLLADKHEAVDDRFSSLEAVPREPHGNEQQIDAKPLHCGDCTIR